jgi:hypothetical protein
MGYLWFIYGLSMVYLWFILEFAISRLKWKVMF